MRRSHNIQRTKYSRVIVLIIMFLIATCGQPKVLNNLIPLEKTREILLFIETDKACYSPGDVVHFKLTLNRPKEDGELIIRYKYLRNVVEVQRLARLNKDLIKWTWQPPAEDYRGYMVEVFIKIRDKVLDQINIAVDISSSWKKFPRYGFLSKYPKISSDALEFVISKLNRYHINGLQFYDWHYKHHMPLKGTVQKTADRWQDIAKRIIHSATVQNYIDAAHLRNMKTMAYNLLYGSWEDGPADGALETWRLYRDKNHLEPVKIDFNENWSSDIYWMNPANSYWQKYIFKQMAKVFRALPFDGWHVDQLGDWGKMWTYDGREVDIAQSFNPFLKEALDYLQHPLVMNAVAQYGQAEIARSPVEFLYSEVWDPDSTYADLFKIIQQNDSFSSGQLATVLAAYVNQGMAERPGQANPASILLTDALIFAAGSSHLELGEHLLGHPYFPNDNLLMSKKLEKDLLLYYDFLVAYQNILRGDLDLSSVDIGTKKDTLFSRWPEKGRIWVLPKRNKKRMVLHMINFRDAKTMHWRDNNGVQPDPSILDKISLKINTDASVKKAWWASPDGFNGSAQSLEFREKQGQITIILPRLKYWSMIVFELKPEESTLN